MSRPITATLDKELTISLTALAETIRAGIADSGQREVHIDDLAIDGLSFQKLVKLENGQKPGHYLAVLNLLDGVDTFDANVIRLLENILAAVEVEAKEVIWDAANG